MVVLLLLLLLLLLESRAEETRAIWLAILASTRFMSSHSDGL